MDFLSYFWRNVRSFIEGQEMKTLITGATELLGKHLMEVVPNASGTWFTNSDHSIPLYQMSLNDPYQAQYIMNKVKPDVIIHCAGIGDVEYAEKNYDETSNINILATHQLHEIAQEYNAQFVYISSNAVYDGDNGPYNETSDREPINRYGSIKKEAENIVMAGRDWLIIRPFMLYGVPYKQGRGNMYMLIRQRLIDGLETKLVNDVYWQPTNALDAAKVIWQLIQQSDTEQIYNIAPDEKPVTLYEFGCKIAKVLGLNKNLLMPVDSSEFPTIAPRPINTEFDTSKIKAMGIEMLGVKKGLRDLR